MSSQSDLLAIGRMLIGAANLAEALANADLWAEDERARLRHRHVPVRTAPASSTG